jgi:hypothetical protein
VYVTDYLCAHINVGAVCDLRLNTVKWSNHIFGNGSID